MYVNNDIGISENYCCTRSVGHESINKSFLICNVGGRCGGDKDVSKRLIKKFIQFVVKSFVIYPFALFKRRLQDLSIS